MVEVLSAVVANMSLSCSFCNGLLSLYSSHYSTTWTPSSSACPLLQILLLRVLLYCQRISSYCNKWRDQHLSYYLFSCCQGKECVQLNVFRLFYLSLLPYTCYVFMLVRQGQSNVLCSSSKMQLGFWWPLAPRHIHSIDLHQPRESSVSRNDSFFPLVAQVLLCQKRETVDNWIQSRDLVGISLGILDLGPGRSWDPEFIV